jgi:hypothetical protein
MSLIKLFEFTFFFNIAAFNIAIWIYTLLAAVVVVLLFGLVWGKMWNREWSLGGHLGSLTLVLCCACCAAFSVFNLVGASRMEGWFEQQRQTLASSVADSTSFNRSVLLSTWDQIISKGGQDGLTPPIEGGDELRLTTPEDAHTLSLTAAEECRSVLRNREPFSFGVPVSTRNSKDVATETVDNVNFSRYPTTVSSNNEWSSTAATIQANHALDTAYNALKPNKQSLQTACWILLLCSLLFSALVIPMNALADIKINPNPKR